MKNKLLGYVLVEMDGDKVNDSSSVRTSLKQVEREISEFNDVAPDFYICEVRAVEYITSVHSVQRVKL